MKEITKHRQRKIDKKNRERSLIRLWFKQQRLWDAGENYNYVELPKPIRKGYVRFFVLREDIARSKDASIYKPLLKFINTKTYCHDKSFMKKRFGKKIKEPIEQYIHKINHQDWNKKVQPILTIKQKSLFDKRWHYTRNSKGVINGGYWAYHFTKPWMFVFKIEPFYVTHRVIINPQLESETQELWNKIYSNNLLPKIGKIFGWNQSRDWNDIRRQLIERAIQKDNRQELNIEY